MHFNESYYSELGNQIKCNPSIKEESDRLALIKALHDKKIDIRDTNTVSNKPNELRASPGRCAKEASNSIPAIFASYFLEFSFELLFYYFHNLAHFFCRFHP